MARRRRGVPQEPGYVPYQPPETRMIHSLADNGEIVSSTDEGVRKDDATGIIKPVNSANGIPFLAILLTATMGGLVYFVVQVIVQDAWDIAGEVWWVLPACIFPFVAAWSNYLSARKAEKLRGAHNIPRPVE